jgi:nucleotide-binding universal stress UspA family protein
MKILVPTDFSKGAEAAVERALELRQRFGATLTLFHAYELPIMYVEGYAFTPDLINTIEDSARKEMEKTKAAAAAHARELGATGTIPIEAKLAIGGPAIAITEEAKAGAYDLIVMGTHGRTGLSHLFIGSVAERVVRTARCPVLTVRNS